MNLPKNCTRFDQKQQKVCVLMCFVVRVWPKILFYFSLWASWLHENNTDNIFQSPTGGSGIPESGSFTGNAFGIEDRKSTRLNSSHVSISYAVFCLKKKIE